MINRVKGQYKLRNTVVQNLCSSISLRKTSLQKATNCEKAPCRQKDVLYVSKHMAFSALQIGHLVEYQTYALLVSQGIKPGKWFYLKSWKGNRADTGALLSRTQKKGLNPKLFKVKKHTQHNRTLYRMPNKNEAFRFFRGGRLDGKYVRRISISEKLLVGMEKISVCVLEDMKELRKHLLLAFIKANPGKHYMGYLADLFKVSKGTIRNYLKELPVKVEANYISSRIEDIRDVRDVADYAFVEVLNGVGAVMIRRNILRCSFRFLKSCLAQGFKLILSCRTANSYHIRE